MQLGDLVGSPRRAQTASAPRTDSRRPARPGEKDTNRRRAVVVAGVQVGVDFGAGPVGDDDGAFDVAFAADDDARVFQSTRFKARASEMRQPVDSRNATSARSRKPRSAQLDASSGVGGHPLELSGIQWFGQPTRELGQVDGDAEVTG